MDTNNWRPAVSGEPAMEAGDWRAGLQPDSRQRIVNKIMETLKRHLPLSGQEGLQELKKIALRFEEKIYSAATDQSDYLRRISMKMLTMETKSQSSLPSSLPSGAVVNSNKTPDAGGSHNLQHQVNNSGQSIPIPLPANQSQGQPQQLLSQNMQNNMTSSVVQSSASLPSALPTVSALNQSPISGVVGQNINMQNISGIAQNSVASSMGQVVPSNIFANQQITPPQQQHCLLTSLDSTSQTGHVNGGDWQEEIFQKIKAMKETYYPELNETYQKIAAKLQPHESLPQQPKMYQYEKVKMLKSMLEKVMAFLQVSKSNITPAMKDKLVPYERQIVNFINTSRPRKPISSPVQGTFPQPHIQPMQQTQSQIPQVQSHENQLNPQLQIMNLQGSVPSMQQNNMSSLQHNPLSSLPGISTSQQMMNTIQPGSNLDSGQGNTLGSLQQMSMGSLQQNAVSAPHQANINTVSSQSGANMLQPNVPFQSNSTMLQHHCLKQQQGQQMLQTHQQLQQHQMQQQLFRQQLLQQQQQQLNQQAKQQLPAQMQSHQISQLHQMPNVNELKIRQDIGIKPGFYPQHLPMGQQTAFPHQQMKSGGSYPISLPQLLPTASQLPQHSSAQVDHQNLLPSLTKAGTPLRSANSPVILPSSSTPLAPSPAVGDSKKPFCGILSLSGAGNVGHQQTVTVQATGPFLATGTPGISASPLPVEFTEHDKSLGLLPQISMEVLQLCPISASQQANINTLSSRGEVNMLQPSFPVQSNFTVLQQQQEQEALQTPHLQQLLQQGQRQQQVMRLQMLQEQLRQSNQQAKTSVGDQQKIAVQAAASLAIDTPAKSATPLLAEFAGSDIAHGSAMATFSSKSSAIMHVIKALLVLFVMLLSVLVVLSSLSL